MAGDDEYQLAQKSALKLKADSGITKKKKKKKKHKSKKDKKEQDIVETPSTSSSTKQSKTKAELAFEKRKQELDQERIRKKASVSHKEKVEKFNEYLNNLSEHYEQAKVSWTK